MAFSLASLVQNWFRKDLGRDDLRSTGIVGLRVSILFALSVNEDVNDRGGGLSSEQRRSRRRCRVLWTGFCNEYAYIGRFDWQRSWFRRWLLLFLSEATATSAKRFFDIAMQGVQRECRSAWREWLALRRKTGDFLVGITFNGVLSAECRTPDRRSVVSYRLISSSWRFSTVTENFRGWNVFSKLK